MPDSAAVFAAVRRVPRRIGTTVFGDRTGLAIFLGSLALVSVYWRVGIFITDTYAVANTLANVAAGHLDVRFLEYSLTLRSQPGLHFHDGAVYGRNYGHVFVSLPVLWLLEALSAVFDLRLVLAAGWSCLWLAFAEQCGRVLGRRRTAVVLGGSVAVGTFLLNAAVAYPLAERWLPVIALQITTMIAAALVGTVLYRLFAHIHGRRLAVVLGFGAVVATPVGFWASVPKRHVFTALAMVVVLTAFYYARAVESSRTTVAARALSYATVALLAWVHAPEALAVLIVLGPIDLITAPSNHPRRLAVVGAVFLVALTPFMLTNYAIAGNPAEPPRTLTAFNGQVDLSPSESSDAGDGETGTSRVETTDSRSAVAGSDAAGNSSAQSAISDVDSGGETTETAAAPSESTPTTTPTGTDSASSPLDPLASIVLSLVALASKTFDAGLWAMRRVGRVFEKSLAVAGDPQRLYHAFVRSGRAPEYISYAINDQEAIELTVLETAPIFGALLGVLAAGGQRLRNVATIEQLRAGAGQPERQTDVLAVVLVVLFSLFYLDRVPTNTQITVRYLLPLVPIGLYAVGRLGAVHNVVDTNSQWLVGSYVGLLLAGGLGLVVAHTVLPLAVGEAMQLHALLALASAVPLGLWALVSSAGVDVDRRIGVVLLALPTALTTLFLLFSGLFYFQYGEFAIPLARTIAERLPVVV